MPDLINSEERLKMFLPNIVSAGNGESSLFEKLAPFLGMAEDWCRENFSSYDYFYEVVENFNDTDQNHCYFASLIVAEALYRALPVLDVVATPNGFSVTSTNNLAPASTARIERLEQSLLRRRDACIEQVILISKQRDPNAWINQKAGHYFGATLFQNLKICVALGIPEGQRWEKYQELHPRIIEIETALENEWFSKELMDSLRQDILKFTVDGEVPDEFNIRLDIASQIKAQVIYFLKHDSFNRRRCADIVEIIRNNKDDFYEWHFSKTSLLFNPPVFKNRKNSGGYFF